MTKEPRIVVIGLDGGTFDVLLPLMKVGHLPNLAGLMERGSWGRLNSTIPPFTGAAWSTFATGQNPGQHGIISFLERDQYNYATKGTGFVDSRRLGHTLWEIAGEHEKRVAVINVPLTYPPRAINGYMVTGMLTPRGARDYTYPPSFLDALGDDYTVDLDFLRKDDRFRSNGFPSKSEILSRIRKMTKARGRLCLKLIGEEHWDFFMVVFTGTDRLAHFLWDELEPILKNDGKPEGRIQSDIVQYLNELDEIVSQIIVSFGEQSVSFVLSDHGFGPSPTKRVYLNIWLEKLGLLHRRGRDNLLDLEYWRVRIGRNDTLKGLMRRIIPERTQSRIRGVAESVSEDIVDWSKTKAYWVPIYYHVCGIEINLIESRREGIVSPGEEYERVRDHIISEAPKIIDPDSGEPIVEQVFKREELYSGPNVVKFPDIILILNPNYITGGSLAGRALAEYASPTRPGEHRQDGIFMTSGPSMLSQTDLPDLELVDVPPTILYAMGLPVPSYFDGRVLTELFDPEYLTSFPIVSKEVEESDNVSGTLPQQLSGDEEEQLLERLRGMGYID
ncbi:MAG TPA: alkaline phosphatase family protein [candidate division Zixibacteria bacterium]|nr:alkaline phosphatase family protein [candidate division Zixibacteria bacterium]